MKGHWLNGEIERLNQLGISAGAGGDDGPFLDHFKETIRRIAVSEVVTAAFGTHDGLVFAINGEVPDPDALGAVAQTSIAAAKATAGTADLGRPLQMVIIGKEHKLALFPVGHMGRMALGILAKSSSNLARALSTSPDPGANAPMHPTILEAIGGREAVELVVADFYQRILKDRELAPFFRGVSMNRLQKVQTDFFVAALSGQRWRGRDLKTVHAGMALNDRHFDLTAGHLTDALKAAGVPLPRVGEILALVSTLRSQIVTTPSNGEPRPGSAPAVRR